MLVLFCRQSPAYRWLAICALAAAAAVTAACTNAPLTSAQSGGVMTGALHAGGPARPPEIAVVREGDTLFSIARRNGVRVSALAAANRLSRYTIYPGQELVIPKSD